MTREEFLERVRNNPRPVVLDVWATWCLPCRQMAPALEQVSGDFAGRVDLWKLDAGKDSELALALGVLGVPTMIVYRQGQELARRVGAQSSSAIAELFTAAEAGVAPARTGLPAGDRMLRLGAALGLAVLGWAAGPSPLILLAAGVVFFSGVYDRCPIWQALAPRLSALVRRPAA
jgi:thioredoxin 1